MQRRIVSGLGLLLAMLWSSVSLAAGMDDGWLAYQSQDYERAYELWLPAAQEGSAMAQNNLGVMYLKGHGVRRDDGAAVLWFERAAAQGSVEAQTSLGALYMEGRGVTRNYFTAFELWYRAARAGYAEAQYNLGTMYAQGVGVTQNFEKALKWFRRAAQQGHPQALASQNDLVRQGLGLKHLPFPKNSIWHKFG